MEALIVYWTLKRIGITSTIKLGAIKCQMTIITVSCMGIIGDKTIIGGPILGYEELLQSTKN